MSNIVVKMMSGEDKPDENTSKGFTLVEAYGEVRCDRDSENKPLIQIPNEDGSTSLYHPEGNTYVLHRGKTVASFSFTNHDTKVERIKGSLKVGQTLGNKHRFGFTKASERDLDRQQTPSNFVYKHGYNFIAKVPDNKIGFMGNEFCVSGGIYTDIEGTQYDPSSMIWSPTNDIDLAVDVDLDPQRFSGYLVKHDDQLYLTYFDLNRGGGKGELILLKQVIPNQT